MEKEKVTLKKKTCNRVHGDIEKAISGNIHPVLVNFLLIVYRVSGVIVWLEIVRNVTIPFCL